MGTVIVVVVVLVLLGVVAFAVALAGKSKRRATEALGGPALAANVPREWAGAHSPEAKMHRRLAAAATALSSQPMGGAVDIEKRVAVEQQILQVDQQLVAAATVPGSRKAELLAELEPLVTAVESSVAANAAGRLELDELKRTQAELDGDPNK